MSHDLVNDDNRPAWDGRRRGLYEVYSLALKHPEVGHGLWIRFMLLASNEPEVKSTAEAWVMFFHAQDETRHMVLRRAIPLVDAEIARDQFHFRVGPCWIGSHESRGEIETEMGRMEWDLRYFSDAPAFKYFPHDWMYRWPWPRTKRLVAQPEAEFHGIFQINGEVFRCQHAEGFQEHIWGTRPAQRWVWIYCPGFEKSPESEVRAYSTENRLAGIDLPRALLLRLSYRGEEILLNALHRWFVQHSRFEPFFWYFIGRKGKRHFVGELSVSASNVLGFQFKDPRGRRVFCYNSQFADLVLKVYEQRGRKFVKVDELISKRCTSFEYAQRTPTGGIPLHFSAGSLPEMKEAK